MSPVYVILLAAGDSTRLKSKINKVLHPLCGRPMIDYVLDTAYSLKPAKISVVVGKDRQSLMDYLKGRRNLIFAHQKERLGTAHAAGVGLKALGIRKGEVLILNGDVPFLTPTTLKKVRRVGKGHPLALVTAVLPDPFGYGRILRDSHGEITGIVEEKNASPLQRQLNEINAGVYGVEAAFLNEYLKKIKKDPLKKEYYLTDLIALAREAGFKIPAYRLSDSQEILGANTRAELAYLNQLERAALVGYHLAHGVGMQDPDSVYVDYGVKIGEDSYLGVGVQLHGPTRLAGGVHVESGCVIKNSRIGAGVTLKAYSYLEDCIIEDGATVGPFARIRPESHVGAKARVGNFVELKKTRLGAGSKANHLSYLGDAHIGKDANIGAGTITCNYDGRNKFKTVIEDQAFIGSDTQLVAPLRVGKGAYVAAGTTLTKNVPPAALALSRVPQKMIRDYCKLKKRKK